jgi:hypothetical protein
MRHCILYFKLLTESDVDFHNLMIIDLMNCMCVNGTLHIMHAVVINGFVNKKTGGQRPTTSINDKTGDG